MHILVKLNAGLRSCIANYDACAGLPLDLDAKPLTPRVVAAHLGLPPESIAIIMVNGHQAQPDTPLTEQATVAFFPAVGGG